MARVEIKGSWQSTKDPEEARAAVLAFAASNKMKPVEAGAEGETLELKGGSQAGMRLLGGWFTKPTMLPRKAEVRLTPAEGGTSVEARIFDTMGVGVMDPKLKKKYSQYCEGWIAGLGAELEG